ncbi:MAG: hypothetical protein JWQ76_2388 [Ramlibacter sp.]|nr:hypothetical protein [Ramlibacter sp.]
MNIDLLNVGAAGLAGPAVRPREATAWQQQLQRAQAAGWFCRSDRLPAGEAMPDRPSAQSLERPAGRGRQLDADFRSTPASRPLGTSTLVAASSLAAAQAPVATPDIAGVVAPMQAPASGHQVRATVIPGEEPLAARVDSAPEATDLLEPRSTVPAAAAKGESPAVRVHIEEGPQGLQFWLGLDGTSADVAARASGLAAELRRQCERAGLLLANVRCNGLAVAGHAPAPIRSREEP